MIILLTASYLMIAGLMNLFFGYLMGVAYGYNKKLLFIFMIGAMVLFLVAALSVTPTAIAASTSILEMIIRIIATLIGMFMGETTYNQIME